MNGRSVGLVPADFTVHFVNVYVKFFCVRDWDGDGDGDEEMTDAEGEESDGEAEMPIGGQSFE